MIKVYLAGGWFTPEQEEEHTRVYQSIKDKFDVFNPKEKGIVDKNSSKDMLTQILLGNVEGIQDADVVLAIYDYKDTGTIWEAGFAYASKKPIVYYAEKLNGKKFNIMLSKTGLFCDRIEDIEEKLRSAKYQDIYFDYNGDIE